MNSATALPHIDAWRAQFQRAWEEFDPELPLLVLTHHDVDGLSAAAILKRAGAKRGREMHVRILGRGENPWTDDVRRELAEQPVGGLMVTDLGVRAGVIRAATPTVLIDHHHPMGQPAGATVISGFGAEPTPTSGLLAFWCASALADVDDLLWLAGISLIADMEEKAGFEEMELARARYGITHLRKATSLLNAARRSGAGIATPALELLLKAEHPRDVLSGRYPETGDLERARAEVAAALDAAKRTAPKVKGEVALIMLDSPCQIHPLIAQQWKTRLHKNIVMAANKGYRPGWVHFSIRSATGVNLIEFLKRHAPPSADENYGSGHVQATGGALKAEAWNEFISGLGYGPEMHVNA